MQVVIDMSETEYEKAKFDVVLACQLIRQGTPLPKGHGRLIDADRLVRVDHIILESTVDNTPTIIEADKE